MSVKKYHDDLWTAWAKTNSLYMEWADRNQVYYYSVLVLYALDRYDRITQKEICEQNGIAKTTVNGVVRKLVKDGYVVFEPNPEDRREKYLHLTESGKSYAKEKLAALYDAESKVIGGINPKRIEDMIETLQMFNTLFESYLK